MKRLRLVHTTEYRFESEARHLKLQARLQPLKLQGQQCEHFQIVTRPPFDRQADQVDGFGNPVASIEIQGGLRRLTISALSTVIMRPPTAEVGVPAPNPCFTQATPLVPLSEAITAYGRQIALRHPSAEAAAEHLNDHLHREFTYRPNRTDIHSTAEELLIRRKGVCQDFAHLAIGLLRSRGFAARYVSGYLHTAALRGQAHRIASDASHAWFELFEPGKGWLGFDPVNGRRVDDNYIIVAYGRDYNDACPLQGTYEGGGPHTLTVAVDIQEVIL
jgi:transglutaminase-like putative cysteine protease